MTVTRQRLATMSALDVRFGPTRPTSSDIDARATTAEAPRTKIAQSIPLAALPRVFPHGKTSNTAATSIAAMAEAASDQ
jgi:hypothetical protein